MKMDNEAIRLPPSALMKGRTMKKIALLLLFVALLTLVVCSCSNTKSAHTANEVAKQIVNGMTYEDVCGIVGTDGVDVGSGTVVMEWKFSDHDYLQVCFDCPTDQNAAFSEWIVSNVLTSETSGR